MPIYEYRCKCCGETTEELQSFNADPPEQCDDCGEEGTLERLVSEAGVVFKGSGFYVNDSDRNGATNGASKPAENGSAESDEAVASEADSDTKSGSGCCGGGCACAAD